jgi:hypothetical protein
VRPSVGAAVALVVPALIYAGHSVKLFGEGLEGDFGTLTLSFFAGYSEKFVLGTIDAPTVGSDKAS